MKGCPGQNMMFRTYKDSIFYVKCSECGYKVEFFWDDRKRICDNCGTQVQPDLETLKKYNNCAISCKSARECLGDEEYLKLVLTDLRTQEEGESELKKILSLIPSDEKEVIDYLSKTIKKNLQNGFLLEPETDIDSLNSSNTVLFKKTKKYLNEYFLID